MANIKINGNTYTGVTKLLVPKADNSGNETFGIPDLQSKTATPTTSQQSITPDSGYDGLSAVTVNAMPSGSATTPATTITAQPTISVSASGLITASNSKTQSVTPTVSAGYVASGTAGNITVDGSNTKQLTVQAAKTVTPTTSAQTAVASGVYTTGAVTVAAIQTETKTATANGTVTPTSGKYLTSVTVAIPTYDGSVT